MPVQIGSRESDFSNPLGLLSDCHRRIESFLDILIRVCEKAQGAALDPPEQVALEKALAYFRNSAPKHTADEEESLFPRLRRSGGAQASLDCLAGLESDHQAAARDHEIVDSIGRLWLSQGRLGDQQIREMSHALERLSTTYQRHIAIEDTELFPLAARVLPPQQLTDVGREMAERRGVTTSPIP
jgi:hemerythrin-like domain-containing protein